jgi:four helix bundle protein
MARGEGMNANVERPTSNVQRPTKHSPDTARGGNYDLEERLLEFASRIIKLVENLPKSRAGNHIAGQLLRSGTSALPNHGEAQAAESVEDFIHKLKLGLKELRESFRWLRLIQHSGLIKPPSRVQPLLEETDELIRIFVASVKTAEKRKLGISAQVQQNQQQRSLHQ